MQLKIRRSQREAGIVSTKVLFCIDVRAEFTTDERRNIERYKLHNEVIYNSEASKRHLARSDALQDGSTRGALKSLASLALVAMNLNITIASLQRGHHIECKSMEELLDAEDTLLSACKNIRAYLDTAATFDGREVLIDFSDAGPVVVAQATPQPMTIVPAPEAATLPPAPPHETATRPVEDAEYTNPVYAWSFELPGWVDQRVIKRGIVSIAVFLLVFVTLVHSCT